MGLFMYLGFLSSMKSRHEIEEISGASAGAIAGLLFCLSKGEPSQTLDFSIGVPIKQLVRPNLKNFMKDYGLVPTSKVRKIFSDACQLFMNKKDVTFKELYEWHPVKFFISAYCVDLMRTVYFSVDSTPDMSIIDALSATVAIPFLFSSVKFADGWRYTDGATSESSPGGPFLGRSDVLTLRFEEGGGIGEIKDLKSYAIRVLSSTMNLRHSYDFPTLLLSVQDLNLYDFDAPNDTKIKMFLTGYDQGLKFFS